MVAMLGGHSTFDFVDATADGREDIANIIDDIHSEIRDEYQAAHDYPWVVGFSGGKDSTLVAHLVFAMLLALPRSERKRSVHILANNTLVESPLVLAHLRKVNAEIAAAATAFGLPIRTAITQPDPNQTFWVNLIGRGYAAPTQNFRWCTDRMKIAPTSQYIRSQIDTHAQAILLLGVRRRESATRSGAVARYDNGRRLHDHRDLKGCQIFRPILELTTDEVWEFLASNPPPWGGSHDPLIKLYRDAGGGECPVITERGDVPSCGTSSSRFGCWTCTVVTKDRSLEGLVESGFAEFSPLLAFRDWLVAIRDDPQRRSAKRRNGKATFKKDGTLVPGPFTLAARREILAKLLALQRNCDYPLISAAEIERIKTIWAEDIVVNARTKIE